MPMYAGKNAVVVGGTHGMGRATVERLLAGGAHVLFTGSDETNLDAARRELGDSVLRCDLRRLSEIDQLATQVQERFDAIDLLFVNAGVAELESIDRVTEASFHRTFDVNTKGTFFVTQRLLPQVRDGGAIVFTTSIANETGTPGMAVYSASKAALWSFARVLAAELLPRNIRVNAVTPGFIKTPTLGVAGASAAERDAFEAEGNAVTPMRRLGTSDEVARAVLFLAFEATFTTATELPVDGGLGRGISAPHVD